MKMKHEKSERASERMKGSTLRAYGNDGFAENLHTIATWRINIQHGTMVQLSAANGRWSWLYALHSVYFIFGSIVMRQILNKSDVVAVCVVYAYFALIFYAAAAAAYRPHINTIMNIIELNFRNNKHILCTQWTL